MSFTSIKVRSEDKRAFDRLLHQVALQSDERVSQHELFHRILELALAEKDAVARARGGTKRRSWSRYQFDLGEATDAAAELDDVVYGLADHEGRDA